MTDGVESAIEKARQIAGDKMVVVGAPSVVKQCLQKGLMDEIPIDLIPTLLLTVLDYSMLWEYNLWI